MHTVKYFHRLHSLVVVRITLTFLFNTDHLFAHIDVSNIAYLHTDKWFQVQLSNINEAIQHDLFIFAMLIGSSYYDLTKNNSI